MNNNSDNGNVWECDGSSASRKIAAEMENMTKAVSNQGVQPSGQPFMAAAGSNEKPETGFTRTMKENFGFFGLGSFLYACFYTFCLFKNASGITFPFFIAGSLFYMYLCLSKLEISLKKGSIFYMAGILLLAVSTFCTDDGRIIALNKTGIFLLIISLMLSQVYDTSRWQLGKYLSSILAAVFASIGEIGRPFRDAGRYYRKEMKGRNKKAFFIGAGFLAALPLFLIVFALLVSADAVFRNMTGKLLEAINFGNVFLALFMIIFMFFASYCILAYLCRKAIKEEVPDRRKGEPLIAVTVTSLLTILYLVFSVIQILYLFMGRMQLPDGYTYAEYAREGFFQLLAVSILNLVIVLAGMCYFRENRALKAVLAVMSLCTFIMIASSFMRMIIYIRYYYLTFLRIFVLWSLAVLFLLFLGVVVNIFRDGFPLFRYSVAVVTSCFLLLSFSHPDYWIAKINVGNMEGQAGSEFFLGKPYQDYSYLAGLSADAAPVLIPYFAEEGMVDLSPEELERMPTYSRTRDDWYAGGYSSYYVSRLWHKTKDISWRTFNISRYMAQRALKHV